MSNDTRCLTEGCVRQVKIRGLCRACYYRERRAGRLDLLEKPSVQERFWAKVDASGDCWEWTAYRNQDGYGRFNDDGKWWLAHRYAYVALIGGISDAKELDHLCRNRACVNPDHLEPVVSRVNILRGFSTAGLNARKTHCKRNHEFTPENTYEKVDGGRSCRQCHRDTERVRYQPRRKDE